MNTNNKNDIGQMVFQKSLYACALDESGCSLYALSIRRVMAK